MNIVFICGSLEEGRDGVGDYTRRLAAELVRSKNTATIISINDHFVNEIFTGEQDSEGTLINVLRLPAAMSMKQRLSLSDGLISRVNADWISLQYVCYAFQQKGLPYRFHYLLSQLGHGRPWQIMFHELWIGMEEDASIKERAWGWLQRQSIRQLVRMLQPKVVHTHTPLYQHALTKLGYTAHRLPLFSNIPVVATVRERDSNGQQQTIPLVLFGGIHHGASVEDFVKKAATFSGKVELKIIGKKTEETGRWASIWRDAGLRVEELGEQSATEVSRSLTAAVAGITTTPVVLMAKSGSVAAMREHGLQIISLSRSWVAKADSRLDEDTPFVYLTDFPEDFSKLSTRIEKPPPANRLAEVADEFVKALSQTNVHG